MRLNWDNITNYWPCSSNFYQFKQLKWKNPLTKLLWILYVVNFLRNGHVLGDWACLALFC